MYSCSRTFRGIGIRFLVIAVMAIPFFPACSDTGGVTKSLPRKFSSVEPLPKSSPSPSPSPSSSPEPVSGTKVGTVIYGDANLDGKVNADDYFRVDRGFMGGMGGWMNGDFNLDGALNADDLFWIDSNFMAGPGNYATVTCLLCLGGDADLNGVVDDEDLAALENGMANHADDWENGDFNSDGVVNGEDRQIYDRNRAVEDPDDALWIPCGRAPEEESS